MPIFGNDEINSSTVSLPVTFHLTHATLKVLFEKNKDADTER
jgi:hypothetical protein